MLTYNVPINYLDPSAVEYVWNLSDEETRIDLAASGDLNETMRKTASRAKTASIRAAFAGRKDLTSGELAACLADRSAAVVASACNKELLVEDLNTLAHGGKQAIMEALLRGWRETGLVRSPQALALVVAWTDTRCEAGNLSSKANSAIASLLHYGLDSETINTIEIPQAQTLRKELSGNQHLWASAQRAAILELAAECPRSRDWASLDAGLSRFGVENVELTSSEYEHLKIVATRVYPNASIKQLLVSEAEREEAREATSERKAMNAAKAQLFDQLYTQVTEGQVRQALGVAQENTLFNNQDLRKLILAALQTEDRAWVLTTYHQHIEALIVPDNTDARGWLTHALTGVKSAKNRRELGTVLDKCANWDADKTSEWLAANLQEAIGHMGAGVVGRTIDRGGPGQWASLPVKAAMTMLGTMPRAHGWMLGQLAGISERTNLPASALDALSRQMTGGDASVAEWLAACEEAVQ